MNSTVSQPTSSYTERLLNIYSTSDPEFYGNVTNFTDPIGISRLYRGVADSYANSSQKATYNLTT